MATSTSFKQECPICEALVPIRDPKLIGKKIKCPKCEGTFVVKEPPEEEDEDEKEEAAAAKSGKKSKTAGNGKVTDKKPDKKPGKADGKKGKSDKGDDGDASPGKKKKKKAGTNMTLVGGGLAIVAVAALGIGGYFLWPKKDTKKPPTPGGQPGPQVVQPQGKKDGEPKDDKGKLNQDKSDLVELTSLLPADATGLFSVNVEQLRTSGVWTAAIQPPKGPFNEASFLKVFGFPFFGETGGVARVVTAVKGKNDWVFSAIRTLQPLDQEDLIKKLRLEKQEVNGQPYYLVRRQFDSIGNLLFKANRPRIDSALCFADAKTFVVADTEEIKKFLQNRPKPDDTAGKKKETIAPYQNFNPDLKDLIEKVEKGDAPSMICMAGDMDTVLTAIEPMLGGVVRLGATQLFELVGKTTAGLPSPLSTDGFADALKGARNNPETVIKRGEAFLRDEGKNAAIALSAFSQDKLAVFAALELKTSADTWNTQYIKPVLDWWATTIGVPTAPPSPMGTKTEKKEGPITATVSGKILSVSFKTDMKTEYNRCTTDFNKAMIQARAEADLANTAPRYHQLAAALTQYVAKTGHFPRGTLARKDNGIDYRRPEDRVSWMAELLPELPESSFGGLKIDPDKEWYASSNLAAAQTVVPHFVVRGAGTAFRSTFPSLTSKRPEDEEYGVTHFVGMAGLGLDAANDDCAPDKVGIFGYNRVTKLADIPKSRQDKVIAVIQVPPAFRSPWIVGGGATIRGVADGEKEIGCVQPFVSGEYKGEKGTFAIMADGKVRFIRANISPELFRSMCTIQGPEKVDGFEKDVPLVPDDEVTVSVIPGAADQPGQDKSSPPAPMTPKEPSKDPMKPTEPMKTGEPLKPGVEPVKPMDPKRPPKGGPGKTPGG